jgi:hypothetical protein
VKQGGATTEFVGQWLKGKGDAEPDGEKWDWFDEQLEAEGRREEREHSRKGGQERAAAEAAANCGQERQDVGHI